MTRNKTTPNADDSSEIDEAKRPLHRGIVHIKYISDRLAVLAHGGRPIDRSMLRSLNNELLIVADILYTEIWSAKLPTAAPPVDYYNGDIHLRAQGLVAPAEPSFSSFKDFVMARAAAATIPPMQSAGARSRAKAVVSKGQSGQASAPRKSTQKAVKATPRRSEGRP